MDEMCKAKIEVPALLGQPIDLPCGVQLKNRLVKSAMSDSLGNGRGKPSLPQIRLYERWAEGGAALSLIGEVQVTPECPEKPGNLVLTPDADLAGMQNLAQRGSANGSHIWPQLGHAGALAHPPISAPKGPSPLNVETLECEGLSLAEIQDLPQTYARSARLAQSVGFGGVMIHAGHGFLLSQFLSPLFNHRTDGYGGPVSNRFRVIGEIIAAVRATIGPNYPIGIKINSSDMLEGGLTTGDALEVVRLLDATSIDLIDISGGTYFPGAASSSDATGRSGPYFVEFARQAKSATSVPIMATGGFRTRAQAASAVQDMSTDLIGLARAIVLDPQLPNRWLSAEGGDPAFPRFDAPPPGGVTAWYTMRLTALAEEGEEGFTMSPADALATYEARDAERCKDWLDQFG